MFHYIGIIFSYRSLIIIYNNYCAVMHVGRFYLLKRRSGKWVTWWSSIMWNKLLGIQDPSFYCVPIFWIFDLSCFDVTGLFWEAYLHKHTKSGKCEACVSNSTVVILYVRKFRFPKVSSHNQCLMYSSLAVLVRHTNVHKIDDLILNSSIRLLKHFKILDLKIFYQLTDWLEP